MTSSSKPEKPPSPAIQIPEKPPGQHRRLGGRSARVQAAVFEATLTLLQEQGYDALSLASIANQAGIHKTSLYRRWKTKELLVLDAIDTQVKKEFPIPDTGTLRSDLITLVRYHADFLQSPVGQALLRMAPSYRSTPSIGSYPKYYWQQRYSWLCPLFDRAIARGEISAQTNFQLLFEMLVGVLFIRVFILGETLGESLAEEIVDLLLSRGGTTLSK